MSEEGKIGEILDKHKLAKPDLWKDLKVFCDAAEKRGYLQACRDMIEEMRLDEPFTQASIERLIKRKEAYA